jgi:3-deoxy-manno-octulosonate cytidylyltransferase (CMP-KDO synthetase)
MIHQKTMIQRVYENCAQTPFDVRVVTDDLRIAKHLDQIKAEYIMVEDEVETGSERIFLALKKMPQKAQYKYIVNVQGDEPLLQAETLEKLVQFHRNSDFDVATLVRQRWDNEGRQDPNQVKALYLAPATAGESEPSSHLRSGRCLYFSRAPVPGRRPNAARVESEADSTPWFHHIGVYSYQTGALESFFEMGVGYYEQIEGLEQLRLLENEKSIGAIPIVEKLYGVDTPEDIKRVEEVIRESGQK